LKKEKNKMKERERCTIGGVSVWRMTDKQEQWYMKEEDSLTSRYHLFIASPTLGSTPCFPELGKLSIKKELVIEGVKTLSHYTPCRNGKKKVICTISTFKDRRHSKWKAPSHKVGCCPFTDYIKEG